ncbi:NUDIX domain-containing protein [Nafulsella turpanensis]|uniref:NUDIX domain-containing protein n=1 Tax=Nafulsella turpanensis TaxID=1265690 RepID=UPI00058FF911|nr:NUDIX hydrolase [Nafulsella turpanensis]
MAYTYDYPRPAVTVDAVVYALADEQLHVLLIRRKQDPFKGSWAFPGGFMDINEVPEEAVKRELLEETGVQANHFVQIGAFAGLHRDPRHRTVSIGYISLLQGQLPVVAGGDDAAEARWFALDKLPEPMAFDHHEMLQQANRRLEVQLRMAAAESESAFGLNEAAIGQVLNQIS